jgi:uncharacterized protein YkwD
MMRTLSWQPSSSGTPPTALVILLNSWGKHLALSRSERRRCRVGSYENLEPLEPFHERKSTMSLRSFLVALIFSGVAAPFPAKAQVMEDEDRQTLQAASPPQAVGEQPDLKQAASLIVASTNAFRQEQNRGKVKVNAELTAAAQYFAAFMARTNKYGHTADGKRPADRVAAQGYEYCIVLENIAYQYNSAGFATATLAEKFFTGWKESPPHRKNMLDPDVTETGVAIAHSAETGYYYAVQLFGRPHSQTIEFTVANQAQATIRYRVADQTLELPPRYTRTHEQCRPPQVTFLLDDGKAEQPQTKIVRPKGGEAYVVEGTAGKLSVREQPGN